ncbi:ATPase, P-type (transporting), HAD superfamily, subfamily IC [Alkalibacterium putridalgicola]|uniref:ATPase, P-type (Transporting), HAD superfamily, subfamily IC n=1 Tax=Alkalibacterium putridalgicola TaxID=426703 RepID=A0A1H7TFA1_9LACT|nr:HAD-IC family P-type ATPase [Alkalibacterium putridalgicola]GEK89446.1 cation-transporting ATPase [Alkalibacterium putridalgicola]SEL83393.1 ATPase, P-type (transporting), HAD superfamily, subfamily IC [Alkalibacterium putridalgicola]
MAKDNETEQTYYQYKNEDVVKEFDSDAEEGLSSDEAQKRLERDGPNEIEQDEVSKWTILIRQLNNVVIYILIAAVALTLGMGHYSDAVVIGLVIIANTFIGYYQEVNASNALEKIKDMLSTQATVIRDGKRVDIPAEEVVKGDLVYIEAGDNIPADLRLIEAENMKVQESSLTGESGSVSKEAEPLEGKKSTGDQSNMAFSSTSVTNGNGTGVVVATAEETEIGKISSAVSEQSHQKTPLMREIDGLGKNISYVILGVAALLFALGFFIGDYTLGALSLAVITMIVGSIPEGLPATTSVVLAMGVRTLANKKNTIVKTLPAAETLGSVDVIATDKTGTLTRNEMTVQTIVTTEDTYEVTGVGYSPEGDILKDDEPVNIDELDALKELIQSGYEANETTLEQEEDKWVINGEPTDGAFLTLYQKSHGTEESDYEEIDRIPFDSDYRYIASLSQHKESGDQKIYIKGSPDKIFEMAEGSDPDFDLSHWQDKVEELSSKGQRVVAVGVKQLDQKKEDIDHPDMEDGITFLGIVGIMDPPRDEVIESIKTMRKAGVAVKMITGDHPSTAKAIAEQLGLAENVKAITGLELEEMSEDELTEKINDYHVFARTTPDNKLEIVKAYKRSGKVIAMVGDGVNDAPALKTSDIGVAMGQKGTDVSKDSANMVLANDDFSTMETAIHEGRRIYDNIKKSILYLLPTSFAEGLIIAITLLLQNDLPLQATQMLWINMVSAITIQFAFIFEPAEEGTMERPPRDTTKPFIGKRQAFEIAYVSILMAGLSLLAYNWLTTSYGVDQATASTTVVNIMVMSKIFYLFNIRTRKPAFSKDFFSNKMAFVIIGIMLVLQLILTYVPFMQRYFYTAGLDPLEWMIAIGVGLIVLIVTEADKLIRLKVLNKDE